MNNRFLKGIFIFLILLFIPLVIVSCNKDNKPKEINNEQLTNDISTLNNIISNLTRLENNVEKDLEAQLRDILIEAKQLIDDLEENIIKNTKKLLEKFKLLLKLIEERQNENPSPDPGSDPGIEPEPQPEDPNPEPQPEPQPEDPQPDPGSDPGTEPEPQPEPQPEPNPGHELDPSPKEGTDEDKYYKERLLFQPTINLHNDKLVSDEYIYNRDAMRVREYGRTLSLNPNTKNFSGYNSYYDKMNGVSLNNYLETLSSIINKNVKYGTYAKGSAETFKKADVVIKDGKKYYYRCYDSVLELVSSNQFDREHVWPNSRLGVERISGSGTGVASDYYNLRYCLPSLNRAKRDRFFKDSNKVEPHLVDKDGFYPGKTQKGDVARIILYMAVKYPHLRLVINPNQSNSKSYEKQHGQIGDVRLLLKWHKEDPVDDFERNRNEQILKIQGNRNPFVDHPDIFEKVLKLKILSQKLTSKTNKEPDYKNKKIAAVFIKDIISKPEYYL